MSRADDFETRRAHLAHLSEADLEARFWELADELVTPIIETAREYTSPSIERSVLLRMGFSSIESKAIVEEALNRGLLGHGAGHLVYRLSQDAGLGLREAGEALIRNEAWEQLENTFTPGGVK